MAKKIWSSLGILRKLEKKNCLVIEYKFDYMHFRFKSTPQLLRNFTFN